MAGTATRNLGRLSEIAQVAVKHGFGYFFETHRLTDLLPGKRRLVPEGSPSQRGQHLRELLDELGPTFVKFGQLLSTRPDIVPPDILVELQSLQDDVRPFPYADVERVIREELGLSVEQLFTDFDPAPVAAASIGQVHKAITLDGRAVAVKVQYPGIAHSIESDLQNVTLVRRIVGAAFPGLDTRSLVDELRDRLREEVDYTLEADSQDLFAAYYEGHPVIHVPRVLPELSTARVLTSELVAGARFDELLGWDQRERDLAAETIDRFTFRSLYRLHAFNGDPQPGNYLFHGHGRVTFLDFGLTKRFTAVELEPLQDAARLLAIEHDAEGFRRALERAGFLQSGAPVTTDMVIERMGQFYGTVLRDAPMTITSAYASSLFRRYFDARTPLAPYTNIPRTYVILQRINLGLYAVLGSLNATANWRRIAEEIWPFRNGPPSTPIGEAEARWELRKEAIA